MKKFLLKNQFKPFSFQPIASKQMSKLLFLQDPYLYEINSKIIEIKDSKDLKKVFLLLKILKSFRF
jgi:hypothetical protein